MSKILIDEATVKLVLEALESLVFNKPFTHRYGDVITALREALAGQPAQQEPLTDEEIEVVWKRVQANDFHDCVQPFARAIKAKLKEKNT